MRTLAFILAMLPALSSASECVFRSGERTAALVELYTSEGCSSCPPADRWLSGFVKTPDSARVVPLAFHVNYWDYIGWKDRFGDDRYTARQRDFAKATGARTVYTPQVVLAGHDLREWRDASSFAAMVERIHRAPARAAIEIAPRWAPEGAITGIASASAIRGSAATDTALVVAITQDSLSSRVTAGENRGEKLDHNFVVRDMAGARGTKDSLRAEFAFKPRPDWDPSRMRIAAFVQNVKTGEVLQAMSAPICR